MVRLISLAAAGLLLTAADNPDDATKKDLAKLQGTWKVQSAQKGGKDVAADDLVFNELTFDGVKMTMIKDGKPTKDATIKIDPSKKPATVDVLDGDKIVKRGLYDFDGETLKLAVTSKGDDRPTELASKPDSDVTVLVLKREKK
jgi:uncharacterized protein (TIGR03067 family)